MPTVVAAAAAVIAAYLVGRGVEALLETRARAALELVVWIAVFWVVRRTVARVRADARGE